MWDCSRSVQIQVNVLLVRLHRSRRQLLSGHVAQILPKGSATLGTSHKGGTLYMEPKTAIQMNNSSTQLEAVEKKEEERCLFELCGYITAALDDIDVAVSAAVDLDLANARARYSVCAVSPTHTLARVHVALRPSRADCSSVANHVLALQAGQS